MRSVIGGNYLGDICIENLKIRGRKHVVDLFVGSVRGIAELRGAKQLCRIVKAVGDMSVVRTVVGVPLMEGPACGGIRPGRFASFWGFPSRTPAPTNIIIRFL